MAVSVHELGPLGDWLFKGEGNANVVYEYTGSLPHLVGKVLKVRKASSPQPSPATDLERAVWEPVLGPLPPITVRGAAGRGDEMARELLYVQRCLLPLLGAEHVPEQEPISVPTQFLRQLSSASATHRGHHHDLAFDPSSSAVLAVLMPDMTKFPPAAVPPAGPVPGPVALSGLPGGPACSGEGQAAGEGRGSRAAAGGAGPAFQGNSGAAMRPDNTSKEGSQLGATEGLLSLGVGDTGGGSPVLSSSELGAAIHGSSGCSNSSSGRSAAGEAGSLQCAPEGNAGAGARARQQAQQEAQQQRRGDSGQAASPVLCMEIKPKCGFLETCCTVHPDDRHIKHSRSRYQLHQLLKLSEGKVVAPSAYEPTDLFSGESQRALRSLRALFAHPQNNLRLFWDGRPVGVRQGVRAWAESVGAAAAVARVPGGDGSQAGTEDSEIRVAAAAMRVPGGDGGSRGGAGGVEGAVAFTPAGVSGGHAAGGVAGRAEGSAAGATAAAAGAVGANGSVEAAGVEETNARAAEAEAGELAGVAGGAAAAQGRDAEGALLGLLLRVLSVEDVLQRLLAAQQQCPYDIEGVHALYCKLLRDSAAAAAGGAADAEAVHPGDNGKLQQLQAQQQQQLGCCEARRSSAPAPSAEARPAAAPAAPAPAAAAALATLQGPPDTAGEVAATDVAVAPAAEKEAAGSSSEPSDDPSFSREAALHGLLALAPHDAQAVLRRYVVSATAKDCAVMVSLQWLGGAESNRAGEGLGDELESENVEEEEEAVVGKDRVMEGQAAGTGRAMVGPGQGGAPPPSAAAAASAAVPPVKLLHCPDAGGWFRYRVAFVDLDMKPLAKIPQHYALDQRIVAAARAHGGRGPMGGSGGEAGGAS